MKRKCLEEENCFWLASQMAQKFEDERQRYPSIEQVEKDKKKADEDKKRPHLLRRKGKIKFLGLRKNKSY